MRFTVVYASVAAYRTVEKRYTAMSVLDIPCNSELVYLHSVMYLLLGIEVAQGQAHGGEILKCVKKNES